MELDLSEARPRRHSPVLPAALRPVASWRRSSETFCPATCSWTRSARASAFTPWYNARARARSARRGRVKMGCDHLRGRIASTRARRPADNVPSQSRLGESTHRQRRGLRRLGDRAPAPQHQRQSRGQLDALRRLDMTPSRSLPSSGGGAQRTLALTGWMGWMKLRRRSGDGVPSPAPLPGRASRSSALVPDHRGRASDRAGSGRQGRRRDCCSRKPATARFWRRASAESWCAIERDAQAPAQRRPPRRAIWTVGAGAASVRCRGGDQGPGRRAHRFGTGDAIEAFLLAFVTPGLPRRIVPECVFPPSFRGSSKRRLPGAGGAREAPEPRDGRLPRSCSRRSPWSWRSPRIRSLTLLAHAFSPDKRELTRHLLVLLAPFVVLDGTAGMFTAALYAAAVCRRGARSPRSRRSSRSSRHPLGFSATWG